MQPTERVEVRKIYAGSAALFGVYFGLIVGLLGAIFVLISGLVITGGIDLFFLQLDTIGDLMRAAGVIFIFIFCIIFIIFFMGALIFNLVTRMGGVVNFGLAEYEIVQRRPKGTPPQGRRLSPEEERKRIAMAQAKLREAAKKDPELREAREMVKKMALN